MNLFFFALMTTQMSTPTHAMIYGDVDAREEVDDNLDPALIKLSQSVALITYQRQVMSEPGINNAFVFGSAMASKKELPSDTRFGDQPDLGYCTGFLVAPDRLMTAGHCIADHDTSTLKIVFNITIANMRSSYTVEVLAKDIYTYKDSQSLYPKFDVAIIQLDRPVLDRKPLVVSILKQKLNVPVFALGHPSGLPMKFSGLDMIRKTDEKYLWADIDTFGGNSGSPVFSANTREVVGVLDGGTNDFDRANENELYHLNMLAKEPGNSRIFSGEKILRMDLPAVRNGLGSILN